MISHDIFVLQCSIARHPASSGPNLVAEAALAVANFASVDVTRRGVGQHSGQNAVANMVMTKSIQPCWETNGILMGYPLT